MNKKTSDDDLLLRFKDIRLADIKNISDLTGKIRVSRIRHTINYYPFRFFAEGIWAYEYLFNNAVIYYVGTAVEIGLLIKLKPLIEQERQLNAKLKPKFEWLTSHSEPLLSKDLKAVADQVRIMRNCYVHYQNIIAHTAWMDQVRWPEIVEQVKSEYKDDPEIMRDIEFLSESAKEHREKEGMFTIRFNFLETSQEMMSFIKSRYDEYLKWLPGFWSTKKHVMNIKDFHLIYGIESFDALSCIKWGFEILNELNYLRENR